MPGRRKDQQAWKALAGDDAEKPQPWHRIRNCPVKHGTAAVSMPTRRGSWRQADSADAHYNQGNALAHMGEYDAAIEAYDQALALQPDMPDALHNRAIVEQMKEQQEQQQQEQQQQDGEQGESEDSESSSEQQESQQSEEGESQQEQGGEQGEEQESEQSRKVNRASRATRKASSRWSSPKPGRRKMRRPWSNGCAAFRTIPVACCGGNSEISTSAAVRRRTKKNRGKAMLKHSESSPLGGIGRPGVTGVAACTPPSGPSSTGHVSSKEKR